MCFFRHMFDVFPPESRCNYGQLDWADNTHRSCINSALAGWICRQQPKIYWRELCGGIYNWSIFCLFFLLVTQAAARHAKFATEWKRKRTVFGQKVMVFKCWGSACSGFTCYNLALDVSSLTLWCLSNEWERACREKTEGVGLISVGGLNNSSPNRELYSKSCL